MSKIIRFSECLQKVEEYNTELTYGLSDIRGVSNDKRLMPTKANMEGRDLSTFQIVAPGCFVFNRRTTRNGERIGLGFNLGDKPIICTEDYVVFKVNKEYKNLINSTFLYLFFCRNEFDRLARYYSWGSATEFFNWEDMQRVSILLPTIQNQNNIVDTWKYLRRIKEQNDAICVPLIQMCRSYIQELKHNYLMVEIGPYIEEVDERNTDLSITLSQGIANTKIFQDPKQVSSNSSSDRIVRHGYFGYNRATTRNGEKISIAYREGPDCTVSSAYGVFRVSREDIIDPYYLWMWFSRPEFDRYARYMSKGSAHEFFEMDEMKRVRIPLPPINIQKAIASVYKCAKEANRISEVADRESREICSALVQYSVNI